MRRRRASGSCALAAASSSGERYSSCRSELECEWMRTHSAWTRAQPAPDLANATASRMARSESKRSLPSQWTILTFKNPEKLSAAKELAAEARGVLRVVRHTGRDVLDVDLRFREVVRHVPAARGDVVALGHPVQQDLLARDSGGEARREVAVIGEEVV